jgi:Ssp1 endopeptidase immunity protein Rap1a
MLFQSLRNIALAAAMLLNCGACFAEDLESANYIMPGCRSFTAETPPSSAADDAFKRGQCLGIVDTIAALTADVCHPPGVTSGRAVSVVVKYIDDRPARMHENFRLLAREALRAAWPCLGTR